MQRTRRQQIRENKSMSAPVKMPLPDPENFDLRGMTILSKKEWDRIQNQLNKPNIEEEKRKRIREANERRHQLSQDQIKGWKNTIKGQRQAKLEARKLREEKEEEEKVQIDLEEARYQAEKRKEAIEKAKTQQYYQTDRVKGFHSALLLSEVLKEREAQIELNQLRKINSGENDQYYYEQERKANEEATLQEQEVARRRMKLRQETRDYQKQQINKHLIELEQERENDIREGQELKNLSEQYLLEKQRLADIRKAEEYSMMNDNIKQINDVRRMRELERQQEEEEDEECRVFAMAKRKMMKMRAEKEKQLADEKMATLDRIRDKLNAQMKEEINNEDERIRRAQEEAEAKREAEEARKAQHLRDINKAMAENRVLAAREKEEQAKKAREEMMAVLEAQQKGDLAFLKHEEEKIRHRNLKKREVASFQLKQLDGKKEQVNAHKAEQLARDKKNLELIQLEEKQFQEYAGKVIETSKKNGRNVIPLQRAAREGAGGGLGPQFPGAGGLRPSYMASDISGNQLPSWERDSTNQVKYKTSGTTSTYERMGFVW